MFRGLIRNLQAWRSAFESQDAPEVIQEPTPPGREWVLWDVERFFGYRGLLPQRMRDALDLFLYRGQFERQVAERMGISGTNPVGVYATVGLTKLLAMARDGRLPGCSFEFEVDLVPRGYRRGRQPLCRPDAGSCNHPLSLHGVDRGQCWATGCSCRRWSGSLLARVA